MVANLSNGFMDINRKNIRIDLGEGEIFVDLKWYRGASRYNNGCTTYGRRYLLRLVLGRLKERRMKNNHA